MDNNNEWPPVKIAKFYRARAAAYRQMGAEAPTPEMAEAYRQLAQAFDENAAWAESRGP